jgi:uncharacterized protein YaiI (UPF0178 family)
LSVKIWVDADAAPREVKEIVSRAAKRLNVETIFVANRKLATPADAPMVRSIMVRDGANVADQYIVDHADASDLAITADLVAKQVHVIDPRGDVYDKANIASRLSMRNFMDELRGTGVETGGAAPYGDRDKKAFAASFDRLLTKATNTAT